MKKKKKEKDLIDWKISDEKVFWSATVIITALLIAMLCSCKTKKESTVDYQVAATEAYQERRMQEHEKQTAVNVTATRDTIDRTAIHAGLIEIERDSAGRVVKVEYLHSFNDHRESGSTKADTIIQTQRVVRTDTIRTEQTDTDIQGRTKEEKDMGWSLMGCGVFCLAVCLLVILLFVCIKKYSQRWGK